MSKPHETRSLVMDAKNAITNDLDRKEIYVQDIDYIIASCKRLESEGVL